MISTEADQPPVNALDLLQDRTSLSYKVAVREYQSLMKQLLIDSRQRTLLGREAVAYASTKSWATVMDGLLERACFDGHFTFFLRSV